MSMRRCFKPLFTFALTSLLLAGCWDQHEVETLAFVTATGVDEVRRRDDSPHGWPLVELSVQIADIGEGGGAPGDGPTAPGIVLSGRGVTPLDGLMDIQSSVGRVVFVAHNRVAVISADIARHEQMTRVLDFFDRTRQTRRNVLLAIADGVPAREIISTASPLTGRSGEGLFDLIAINHELRGLPIITLHDFLVRASLEGIDPIATRLVSSPLPGSDEDGERVVQGVRARGLALFRGDRLVGFLDDREARGLLWAINRVQDGFVDVPCPGAEDHAFFYDVQRTSGRISMEVEPVLKGVISIVMEGRLGDVECPDGFQNTTHFLSQAHENLRELVEQDVRGAIAVAQALESDPFGFGASLKRRNPRLWDQISARWFDTHWPELPVELILEIDIRRPGITTRPYQVNR